MSSNVLNLKAVATEGVFLTPMLREGSIHISVSGELSLRDPDRLLDPFWIGVDEEAARLHAPDVHVDLRNLGFMNSSGILTLVRWISRAKLLPAGKGYKIVLRYDKNVTWQKNSVPTVAKLAPGIVTAVSD